MVISVIGHPNCTAEPKWSNASYICLSGNLGVFSSVVQGWVKTNHKSNNLFQTILGHMITGVDDKYPNKNDKNVQNLKIHGKISVSKCEARD